MAFGRYVENIKAELMVRTDCSLVDSARNSWFIPNSIKDSWSVTSFNIFPSVKDLPAD
jgi:hypothetical protein